MTPIEKKRILLVEDNEATQTLIVAILQKDFLIDTATEGSAALDKIRTNNYAAIVLDLKMPLMDGFAVLDFIRDQASHLLGRVLVVTASLTSGEIRRARSYGICGVINKPFEIEILMAAVKQCAGGDGTFKTVFSPAVLLLLADILKNRWMS